jgi:hypothetical protein
MQAEMEAVIATFDANLDKMSRMESETKVRMTRLSKELGSQKFDSVIKVQESCELAEKQIEQKLTS